MKSKTDVQLIKTDTPAVQQNGTSNPVPEVKRETLKTLFVREDVKQKFQEMLGKRSAAFMTSVLQIVTQSEKLSKASPMSVYHSACMAATLDLPLNANLGFAYIVPYKTKTDNGYVDVAQFQMGYKGFIQLAQRSGQFKTLNTTDVRQGEIKSHNRLTDDIEFEWVEDEAERLKLPVIAYVSYFKLLNGFEKLHLMYVDKIKQHGAKYSKTYSFTTGLWTTDFDGMARKTVTKLLLSRFAPLSIEMQKAIEVDQTVINDEEGKDLTYIDHEDIPLDKEAERVALMIEDATTTDDLMKIKEHVKPEQLEMFEEKLSKLMEDK